MSTGRGSRVILENMLAQDAKLKFSSRPIPRLASPCSPILAGYVTYVRNVRKALDWNKSAPARDHSRDSNHAGVCVHEKTLFSR